jgi:hypothetical protein
MSRRALVWPLLGLGLGLAADWLCAILPGLAG